ncbi:MAG: Crp/Fnr family transcriptional regulator [Kordiimonadaceae bacterium]|nr:Crp/Fnr family transcriptional regulator [Kordiimonadaceae bacterium]MBO6567351.1 Crp/Fnr family transcriptional regulator [Kordiimonadaceae bacterium]MBO6963435.1 Crp/Fnr family transcriptional regulator [Kordiimonadaceae bacterium]
MGNIDVKTMAGESSAEMIARQPLFKGASEDTIGKLSAAGQVLKLDKGEALFMQEDPAEWFYIMLSGWVKLFRETMDGAEAVIDMATRGELVGETAIFEDGMHSYCAAAAEKVEVLRLPSSLLKKAVNDEQPVALSMLSSMSRHRKRQSREIESLTLQNASQRIGCFLLRHCNQLEEDQIDLQLPYDKSLIAARLGMKSETFSRALNKLRQETNIEVKGSMVQIPSIDVISTYSCSACSNEFPCSDLQAME